MPGATRHPFRTCSALRVVGEPLLSEAKWGGMMWSLAYPPGHGTEMASWGMKNGLFLREKSLSSLLVPVSASSDPTWIRMAPQGPTNILRAETLMESKDPQPSGSRHFSPALDGTPAHLSTQTCLQDIGNTNRRGRKEGSRRGISTYSQTRAGLGPNSTLQDAPTSQVPAVGSLGPASTPLPWPQLTATVICFHHQTGGQKQAWFSPGVSEQRTDECLRRWI